MSNLHAGSPDPNQATSASIAQEGRDSRLDVLDVAFRNALAAQPGGTEARSAYRRALAERLADRLVAELDFEFATRFADALRARIVDAQAEIKKARRAAVHAANQAAVRENRKGD